MKLLLPAVLHRYSGGVSELEVSGDTVMDALTDCFSRHADLRSRVLDENGRLHPYLRLFRNGEPATLESGTAPGDTLEILAAAVGG